MNQLFHIKTQLWPSVGHYRSGQVSPLSLLAFHLQILTQPGNLLKGKGSNDQYFFRDSAIPLPRPATYSAWNALVGLGSDESPYFYTPFLPSIRADEEGGVAGSLRGAGEAGTAHLSTLTRKSQLHIRDTNGRIQWGSVYIGRRDRSESPLVWRLDRSDIPESMVLPREYGNGEYTSATHGGIRTRMEFVAQFGIPGINSSDLPLRPIRRILFQCTTQNFADEYARAYCHAAQVVSVDSEAEQADYLELLAELKESIAKPKPSESVKGEEYIPKSPKLKLSLKEITLNL